MSATQILEELSNLNHEERRRIVDRALELNWTESEREAIEWTEACTLQAFQMMDALEAADASR